jgi:hypothetical protein
MVNRAGALLERFHSHRFEEGLPLGPMSFPALRRRHHSASIKTLVHKIEVTLVVVAEERRNRLQDSCVGSGNKEFYNVTKL